MTGDTGVISSEIAARAIVFGDQPGDRYRAGRTLRALKRAGLSVDDTRGLTGRALAETLARAAGPVWLVAAGAWPARPGPIVFPPRSRTGRSLCALGLVRALPSGPAAGDSVARQWARLQAETGGDFSLVRDLADRLPSVVSTYLEATTATAVAHHLSRGEDLDTALRSVLRDGRLRVLRHAPLDVHHDSALRVVQLVTSLQRGGAERIALQLAGGLSRYGVSALLVALGRPTRTPFSVPPGTLDLSALPTDRATRLAEAARAALDFAADVVHGHLLHGDEAARLSSFGLPLLLTVHNMRPGWPPGLETLHAGDAALLVACARAVEVELRDCRLPVPVRTVWNGIDFAPFERRPALQRAAEKWRRQLGCAEGDFVLLALANPRPQKRLHMLPGILAATRAELVRRGTRRAVRLVLAGESSCVSEAAAHSEAEVRAEAARLGLQTHVHFAGAVEDVAGLLAAADVLVSSSAYEGLSLAHLEALAAGIPVVATDAGGTIEVSRDNPAMVVLPLDASAGQFGRVLAEMAETPSSDGRTAAMGDFTTYRMLEGYLRLYPRAIAAGREQRRGAGLLLVANNFSIGGAQSSARRLLLGLAADGVRVRAAVLQEDADFPTPGRRTLTAAGVPVLVLPRAGTLDPARAVAVLLEALDADPPAALLLWNVIAEYKLLLADALLDVPLYDVSPGEMYYSSLERYFQRPRPGLPYRSATDYGARLAGVIVKYRAEAEQARRLLGVPVHVIANGVVLERQQARHSARERLAIGTAARISPQKKLPELLAAIRRANDRLPPYVLRIAGGVETGSAAHAEELRLLADGLPVEWVGEVEDMSGFLRELDLFALVAEPAGCPNASLEAMAAGLPVVATDVGGMAEQVADGFTGRLVSRGDVQALAEALVEMGCNAERRQKCGAAGRARAEERFSLRRMLDDYRRVCLTRS